MTTIYGINNCDTVKKALKWLDKNNINYEFVDFKKQPLTAELLQHFVNNSHWQLLLNKRSTTFRNLPDEIKQDLSDENLFKAVLAQPTLLKRPLLQLEGQLEGQLHLGFKDPQYQALFTASDGAINNIGE
jgi:Spx/MgsR family transcriptional regulator